MENRKIIAANPGGISNRIKCLISMWRLGDKYGRELLLYWPSNHTLRGKFNDLFENQFPELKKEDLKKIDKKNLKVYRADVNEIPESAHEYLATDNARWILFPGEREEKQIFPSLFSTKKGNDIDHEFEGIPMNIRKDILEYLKRLVPISFVREEVEKFLKKNDLTDFVGIHARRGDFLLGKEGLGKVSSNERFFEEIDKILKENPEQMFFLCTDCEETENLFKSKLKEKVIVYPKNNRDRENVSVTQEGLVDLILLSKTKKILGTYLSTFTELAWWLGSCKAPVIPVIDENYKREFEAKKSRMDRNILLTLKIFIATKILKKGNWF